MVNDADQASNLIFNESDGYWTEHIEVTNFAGKNVLVAGVLPVAGTNECVPNYMPTSYFTNLVNQVLTNSNATPQDVIDILYDIGCPSFGLKPLIGVAVKDKSAGLEEILYSDCTFSLTNGGTSNDWQILMYAVIDVPTTAGPSVAPTAAPTTMSHGVDF